MKEDVYGLIEEHYLSTKSRIIAHLQTTKSMETTSTNADAGSVLRQIQLPKINLPTFDGDPLAWEGFRDLFKSLVHEVDGLAPIQKLQYLKASLAGEAAAVVSSIEMSAEGYALAWDELSSQEINRLISTANQSSRSFRALGRPVEHWDDWFVHIIFGKLDSSTRLLWESSQESSSDFPSFTELKTFLLTRARALEAAHPRSTAITSETKGGKRNGRKTDVSSHSSSTREVSQCPLCKARHPLRSCDKFKTFSVEQRREQARRSKACFNCLGHNHAAAACPSINRCRHCWEKHHSLLHIGVIQSAAPTIPQDSNAAITSLEKSVHQADATAVAALASTTNNTVLLATAMIKLISYLGRTVKVRALLDSGSKASLSQNASPNSSNYAAGE
ncbi:uncharacterized protein LOC114945455 [Nylanderia fulva]|uniref:uncharacterized protein LOC114945455 n=1 Tax=Nylanderia fulva TaxID=613905 RepID=UPI0010FB6696|nr:uncharacterized protein LOC114945455 [Nylanderia fulva]